MKIFFLIQEWEPFEGPAQWRVRKFLDAADFRGHSCKIITPTQSSERQETLRSRVKSSETSPTLKEQNTSPLLSRILRQGISGCATVLQAVRATISEGKPDIIFATIPAIPTGFAGYAVAKLVGAPLVIDLRDAWPELIDDVSWSREFDTSNRIRQRIVGAFFKVVTSGGGRLLEYVLLKSDLIVTTTTSLRHSLTWRGHGNVLTIRNSAQSPCRDTGASEPCHHREEPSPLRILYAGNVGRAQGLGNAIVAVRLANDLGSSVQLRIVGDGPELAQLKSMASETQTAVRFFSYTSQEHLELHYQWADACLVHLRDWNGLRLTVPSKLYEIMARGIPISLSAAGESAEIVRSTGAGEVADPMAPRQLADMWHGWASNGLPEIDSHSVNSWLRENADPDSTANHMIDALETLSKI